MKRLIFLLAALVLSASLLSAQDNIGNKSNVNLVYYTKVTPEAKDSIVHYSFGYPVFMAGSPYGFMLQACEKYYWNNDPSKKVDIVKLNAEIRDIVAREQVLRDEIDKIIAEIEGQTNE